MGTFTPNYQLHQWDPEDNFLRTDFNTDLSKIDTALKNLLDQLGEKANQSTVNDSVSGLQNSVNGSILGLQSSINNSVSQLQASIANLQSQLDGVSATASGRCRIITGTYSGTYQPQYINIGAYPQAVIVFYGVNGIGVIRGQSSAFQSLAITSTGFSVGVVEGSMDNINVSGRVYLYAAFV